MGVSISIPFDMCLLAFVRDAGHTRLPIRLKVPGKSVCSNVGTSLWFGQFAVVQGLLLPSTSDAVTTGGCEMDLMMLISFVLNAGAALLLTRTLWPQ
jgi:hypothetical protein